MKAEPAPLVLSASSVQAYLRCGLAWYLGYVLGVKASSSGPQVLGIAGHKAVEANMAQKIDSHTDLPEDDVLDAFSDAFDEQEMEEVEKPGLLKDSGVAAVREYHRRAAPTIQPIEVEKPIQFAVNSIAYSGQLDLIDDAGRIRDTKFVGRKPEEGKYKLNMIGYAIGYRQGASTPSEPVVETDTVLDVMVRNKRPQYVQMSAGGPVSEHEIRRFASILKSVQDNIQKGSFPPNGLATPGTCRTCNFYKVCPAVNGAKK